MEGAVLTGALLIRANLSGSDLTAFQYKRARTIEEVILPTGQIYSEQ
jgi:uncharacterized protein YjbI with pentapeptide repeats